MSQTHVPTVDSRAVFVVHGRELRLRDALFAFLTAIDLRPLEFVAASLRTGKATPYVGDILALAFQQAQAIVVLFTPDDEARLRPQYARSEDPAYETEFTPQARPNVLFEAGMAMGKDPDRTVLVQIGRLRPFSDIGGRHLLLLDNSTQRRQELALRLKAAGCAADITGTAWHTAGDLSLGEESLKSVDAVPTVGPPPPPFDPTDVEVAMLKQLAAHGQLSFVYLISYAGNRQKARYHVERLEDAGLIGITRERSTGEAVELTKKGRAFAFERGL